MQNCQRQTLDIYSSVFVCATCGFQYDMRNSSGPDDHLTSHSLYLAGLRLLGKPGYSDRYNGALKILKSFYNASLYNAVSLGLSGHPEFERYSSMVFDLCEEIPDSIKRCLSKDLGCVKREIEAGTIFWTQRI